MSNVSISVGQVAIGDNDAKIKSSLSAAGLNDYKIENRYESDRHVYMLGITSPEGFQGSAVAFAQIASPTLIWICDWTASWFGKSPPMPDPEKVDTDNWVLLDDHYEAYMIGLSTDGETPLYRLQGTYVYGHTNPNTKPILDVVYPKPPHFQDIFERTIKEESMEGGISSPGGGSAILETSSLTEETSTTSPGREVQEALDRSVQ